MTRKRNRVVDEEVDNRNMDTNQISEDEEKLFEKEEFERKVQMKIPKAIKRIVQISERQTVELGNLLIEERAYVTNLAESIKDLDNDQNQIDNLEDVMIKCIGMEDKCMQYKEQLGKLVALCDTEMNPIDIELHLSFPKDVRIKNIKETTAYIKFSKAIGKYKNGNESEEDVVIESGESTICPITTMELVKPMKSNVCPHRYSQHAIVQYLKKKNVCPVAGCKAKLSASSLQHDVEFEIFMKSQGSRRIKSQSAGHEAEDIDSHDEAFDCS